MGLFDSEISRDCSHVAVVSGFFCEEYPDGHGGYSSLTETFVSMLPYPDFFHFSLTSPEMINLPRHAHCRGRKIDLS